MAVLDLSGVVAAAAADEAAANLGVVVVMLLAGLGITMFGLWLLTSRTRSAPDPVEEPAPEEDDKPRAEPETPGAEPGPPADPCDWELWLDTGDATTLLRAAEGRACCVHTLRLASRDPWPVPPEPVEQLTWSGEHTQIRSRTASTRTRRDVVTAGADLQPTTLHVAARIQRGPGPTITTSRSGAADGAEAPETLWADHLRRLQDEDVHTQPTDATVAVDTQAIDRRTVDLEAHRGCDGGLHTLDARGSVRATVTGAANDTASSELAALRVAAWLAGDLDVAATAKDGHSPGVRVSPLTGAPGVAVTSAAEARAVSLVLTGEDHIRRDGVGLAVTLGGDVAMRLSIGAPRDTAADGHLDVTVAHDLVVTVTPPARTEPGSPRLQCACAPNYELRLGDLPRGGSAPSSSTAGHVVVDGRTHLLQRARGEAPDDPPGWRVAGAPTQPDDEADPDGRGDTSGDTKGAGAAADSRRAGTGQHIDAPAGGADGHAAGRPGQ